MRLFVAVPIPDGLRSSLAAAVAPLRADGPAGVRWTRPEGWHVTLAFLGAVPDERWHEVVAVVDVVAADGVPIGLASSAAGRFGRDVLWLGLDDEPAGALARMGEQVQEGLEAAGLPVQRRPVHPHVTLARSRRRAVGRDLVERLALPPVRWRATSVQVWSSQLGNGPARYAVEHEASLRGGGVGDW